MSRKRARMKKKVKRDLNREERTTGMTRIIKDSLNGNKSSEAPKRLNADRLEIATRLFWFE